VDETGRRELLECKHAAFWIMKWNGRLNLFNYGMVDILMPKPSHVEDVVIDALQLLDLVHSRFSVMM